MSVYLHAMVRCDFKRGCPHRIEHGFTKREVRAAARQQGWTYVRSPLGRPFDTDFCPDHKPEPEGD